MRYVQLPLLATYVSTILTFVGQFWQLFIDKLLPNLAILEIANSFEKENCHI